MYQQKSKKLENNKEVVHFSNKQTFYYEGLLFKIFKTNSKHPKAPELAILRVDTQERISGLFRIGTNLFQGDIKQDKDKAYFRLRFIEKNTLELTNFREALLGGGHITPEEEIIPFLEPYRASNEPIKGATGVMVGSGIGEQLKITS